MRRFRSAVRRRTGRAPANPGCGSIRTTAGRDGKAIEEFVRPGRIKLNFAVELHHGLSIHARRVGGNMRRRPW